MLIGERFSNNNLDIQNMQLFILSKAETKIDKCVNNSAQDTRIYSQILKLILLLQYKQT